MDNINQEVRSHVCIVSDRMKKRYDIRATEGEYAEEDLIWLCNLQRR